MAVEAAAGPGALNEEFAAETARWHLPEGMLRHEGAVKPENLRILRVRGNLMEPEMRDGDRLMVDISRRVPATGEMFVLWDGNGLVVKRVETMRGDPSRLRLISANPDYAPFRSVTHTLYYYRKRRSARRPWRQTVWIGRAFNTPRHLDNRYTMFILCS